METINVLYTRNDASKTETYTTHSGHYYQYYIATNAEQAIEVLSKNKIHALISDLQTCAHLEQEVIKASIRLCPQQIRIVLSHHAMNPFIADALENGQIFKNLLKPCAPEFLMELIDKAYEIYVLNQTRAKLEDEWQHAAEHLNFLMSHGEKN